MWQQLLPGLRMTLVMTILTGVIYPLAVTGLCQVFFRDKANGSLITVNGQVIGSELIGQNFIRPDYFHPRPSHLLLDDARLLQSSLNQLRCGG